MPLLAWCAVNTFSRRELV